MTFSISPYLDTIIDDASLSNVVMSPQFVLADSTLMDFNAYLSDHSANSHLDVYMTSVLGQPMTLLASYLGSEDQDAPRTLCVPAGRYQLSFVAFSLVGDHITLKNTEVTQTPCNFIPLSYYGMYNVL